MRVISAPPNVILSTIMSNGALKLPNPPIVEAVLDIECDMPPGWQIAEVETKAREVFRVRYPKFCPQYFQQHTIETNPVAPSVTPVRHGVAAYQFIHEDEKQLVQLRVHGYSFNRLAPYTDLDDYLPEIKRTWNLFRKLISPVLIRQIRLRYINRILIPLDENEAVDLDQYLAIGPRLPDETDMTLEGFLNHTAARDAQTGHTINLVLTNQPNENKHVPIVFDNCVNATSNGHPPDDWDWILKTIRELRTLKNRVFEKSMKPKCISLFQQL